MVSLVSVFKPLATSREYKRITMLQRDSTDVVSYIPGENIRVLYLNTSEAYEGHVMASQRYADLGGFATISECGYLLPPQDYTHQKVLLFVRCCETGGNLPV